MKKNKIISAILALSILLEIASPVLAVADLPTKSKEGNATNVDISQTVSPAEAQALLGNNATSAQQKTAEQTEAQKTENDLQKLKDTFGFSGDTINQAVTLHGSFEAFQTALFSFQVSAAEVNISSEVQTKVLTLICNGYTNGQAFTAAVSSDILGVDWDTLIAAKAEEIQANRIIEEGQPEQATYAVADEDALMQMDEELLTQAIKLGVPYTVIEQYRNRRNAADFDALKQQLAQQMAETYPEKQSDESEPDGVFINSAGTLTSDTATFAGQNEYIPKRILSKPFSFATDGNLTTNLNSGEFSYAETDLYIPGAAGLDLDITRRYDATRSQYADPVSMIIPGQETALSFKVGYRPYLYYCNGCSHTDYTQCSKSLITNMNLYTLAHNDMYSEHGLSYDNPTYSIKFQTQDYDYALAFKQQLPMSLYAATDNYGNFEVIYMEPFLSVIEPTFSQATYNFTSGSSETLARYGLAPGWSLSFSSIEQYTGNDFYNRRRLVTADGRQFEVDFYASNGSGLAEYKLKDMKLENSGNGYPNAAYTLTHKDGKREYFNANGDNIAIVDKYGNKITLEHIYINGKISRINITDTLGNNIVYKNDNVDPSVKNYPAGKSGASWAYHVRWSLSLNGTVLKEYYSRIGNMGTPLPVTHVYVRDANNEFTVYGSGVTNYNFNAFSPTATTNDAFYKANRLSSVQYENRLMLNIKNLSLKRRIGYTGYEQYPGLSGKVNFNDLDGTSETVEESYTFSDYTGLNNVIGWVGNKAGDSYQYTTKVSYDRMKNSIRLKWNEGYTYYTFDEAHRKTKIAEHKAKEIAQDEIITSIDAVRPYTLYSNFALYKSINYLYNENDLPVSETETYYSPTGTAGRSIQKRYTYDNKGNVLTYTAPNNQVTTYTYDSAYSMPLTVEYKQNAATTITQKNTLSPDKKSVMQSATNESGTEKAKTVFAYDTKGRLINEKAYADATNYIEKQYDYGNSGQIVSQKTIGVKNHSGALVSGSPNMAAGTVETKFAYDSQGKLTSTTDGNGNTEQIAYTSNGRIAKVTHADGSFTSYSYDVVNNKVVYTNELGHKVEHTYDLIGNEISIKDLTLGKMISQKAYDSNNRMYKEWFYNESGGVESEHYYYYDAQNRIIEQGIRNPQGVTISKEGKQYQDWLGKATSTIYGDAVAPSVVTVEYYDVMNNVIKSGNVNNGTEVIDDFSYDYAGNMLQKTTAYTKSKSGSFTEKYTYDYANRLTSVQSALGTVHNTYDSVGRLLSQSDLEGNLTTFAYDALGRKLKDTMPFALENGSMTHTIRTYEYDNADNLLYQDHAGIKNSYTYNARNLMTEARSYNGGTVQTVSYAYNALGQPTSMTTGNGATTQYSYDTRGNVVSMKDALNQTEQYAYDILGRLTGKTDRNGQNTAYAQDPADRITNIATVGDTVSTVYTLSGLTKQVSNVSESTNYTYDNYGRVVQELTGNVKKQYTYDVGDNRTKMQIFVGSVKQTEVAYRYDAMSRLTQVSDGTSVADYTYDARGNLSAVQYNNGMREEYTYNLAGGVTKVEHKRGGTVVNRYTYTYTPDGNQTSKTMLENGVDKGVVTYAYDGLNQLIQEKKVLAGTVVQQYDYAYDLAGNRTKMTASGTDAGTTTYAYDRNNRLTSETKVAAAGQTTKTYAYDANGNTLSDGSATYAYNGFNRLVSLAENGTNISYAYNAAGLRTQKNVGGVVTGFVWDEGKTVLETNGSGGVTAQYLQGFRTVAQQTAAGRKYYGFNGHGDVVSMSDTSGNIVKQYAYNAFGVEENPDASDTNPFRYCGEYFDQETGSIYLRARYYDPSIGRFTTSDPHWNTGNMIYGDNPVKMNEQTTTVPMESTSYTLVPDITAINQSGNLYGYGMNNPVMYADPDGELTVLATIAIGAGIGALISGGFQMFRNVKNGNKWSKNLGRALLAGATGGAISVAPIPGIKGWALAAITGSAGNLASQTIVGEIKTMGDVVSALSAGAIVGIIGNAAADKISVGFQSYFRTLTKVQQKAMLSNIGNITNRQLTAIRQEIKRGLTNSKLVELVKKYGYDVIVSAFVSSTAAEGIQ